MQQLTYKMRFLTPAFLGNAEQSGQWRTPPFKALLRQWWRVVWAAKHGFDVAEMRRKEGLLFGNAWLEGQFRKSAVRVRLSRWDGGRIKDWNNLEGSKVFHPEVEKTHYKVGPHAYLGFGPLDGRGGTKLAEKVNAAIQAGETATLSIAAPDAAIEDIQSALALIDAYATAGGRSRNGWGSFALVPTNGSPAHVTNLAPWQQPWTEALTVDWPHAIGRDGTGPLIWQTTRAYDDWKALMRDLAIIKIGLRTMFQFPSTKPPHLKPLDRHWLAYPVTTHTTRTWKNARLPNSLRFKARPDQQSPGKLRGVIFHVPCLPPPEFKPNTQAIHRVWEKSHQLLDGLRQPASGRTYAVVADEKRRNALKAQLDTVALERIPG